MTTENHASILIKRLVAHVMQTVFDGPQCQRIKAGNILPSAYPKCYSICNAQMSVTQLIHGGDASVMASVGLTNRQPGDGVSRRDFLRVGGLSVLGLSAAEQSAQQRALAEANGKGKGLRRCIFVLMTGGPSHLETFDPKPNAPVEYRGPFRAISTALPGVQFSETLPLLAQRADRLTVLRSLWHDAAPIHETGQQLIQTGRLARGAVRPPSLGSVVARLLGPRNNLPAYAVLPAPLGNTGVEMWQGQRAGFLGPDYDPWDIAVQCRPVSPKPAADVPTGPQSAGFGETGLHAADGNDLSDEAAVTDEMTAAMNWQAEPEHCRRLYGETQFGRSCLLARRLVERGVRFVTVNMFDSLANRVTWDCHANGRWAPGGLADYRDTLCPDFDRAFSGLLDDLAQHGLLQETLVVATGEFGRTPRVNEFGGRDHWPGVWSALLAGGGIPGGAVLGASDARGISPADLPVEPGELAATILTALGIDLTTRLAPTAESEFALVDREPIRELIG